jgi:hypothetical protein
MGVERVSRMVDEDLLAEAGEVVGSPLQHDRIAGLLAAMEQEYGPVEPEVLEEVRQVWPVPSKP